MAQIRKFCGSKYVQSDCSQVFPEIKEKLRKGICVLFVGTPCQVDGLNRFLRKSYDQLLTCDFICHGVPSPGDFEYQKKILEDEIGSTISNFEFRSKDRFGQGYDIKLTFSSGKCKYIIPENLPFFNAFWKNINLRESCYSCRYASYDRCSDITLGDYWNFKKIHSHAQRRTDVSLLIASTEKGINCLNSLNSRITLEADKKENLLRYQSHLKKSAKKSKLRIKFENDLSILSRSDLFVKYYVLERKDLIKAKVRTILKTVLLYKLWK